MFCSKNGSDLILFIPKRARKKITLISLAGVVLQKLKEDPMTIVRISKDSNNPYVILNKKFLEDPDITLKLKGFLAYCLSKPDDWEFHVRQLASVLKEGKTSLYNIINEGIQNGYITREVQKKDGKFETTTYVIYETKIVNNSTVSAFLDVESLDVDSRTLLSNDSRLSNEKTKIHKGASPPTPALCPSPATQPSEGAIEKFVYTSPYSGESRVHMKVSEYKSLVDKYSKEVIDEKLEDLDEYADINPKKFKQYTNHASVIHAWLRKDGKMIYKSKPTPSLNKELAIKIMQLNPRHAETGLIQLGYNYIEFRAGTHCNEVKFEDNGFREQCFSYLRKMNLKIPGVI